MAQASAQRAPRVKPSSLPWLKPGVLVGSLVPLLDLGVRAARGSLGANPVSEALNRLGLLALIFLLASLTCTPLRLLFGWGWPMRLRRMLGLLAFAYAGLHFSVYVLLDRLGAQASLAEDLTQCPFIALGFLAFSLLVPLAVTSTPRSIKALGAARWRRLHQLVYPAVLLAVLHFVWRVKRDLSEPLMYGAFLGCLFAVRGREWLRRRQHR